jgi:hypothetical protein
MPGVVTEIRGMETRLLPPAVVDARAQKEKRRRLGIFLPNAARSRADDATPPSGCACPAHRGTVPTVVRTAAPGAMTSGLLLRRRDGA